jgi:hypothetical protein
MCDPLTAVAAVGAVASAGVGLYEGQQASSEIAATRDAQNQANAQWIAYQTRIHNEQAQAEDEARQKATASQQATLQKVSPEAQTQTQTDEQNRLNSLYNKSGAGAAAGGGGAQGTLLSGEQSGDQTFMGNLTKQVSQATAQARQRIGALATASSYGGSFGGLGTTVPIAFAQGGNDINLQNAIRQGNLKTYGVEQQVQPIQYTVGPGTAAKESLSKGALSLAGSLAGMAGPKILGGGGLGGFGGGDVSGVASGGGLSPSFSSAALTSFNDPVWNQWG